jgi:hypothetical protein
MCTHSSSRSGEIKEIHQGFPFLEHPAANLTRGGYPVKTVENSGIQKLFFKQVATTLFINVLSESRDVNLSRYRFMISSEERWNFSAEIFWLQNKSCYQLLDDCLTELGQDFNHLSRYWVGHNSQNKDSAGAQSVEYFG